jgi:hypothetical protein
MLPELKFLQLLVLYVNYQNVSVLYDKICATAIFKCMEDAPFLISDCRSNIEKIPCLNARLVSRVYKLGSEQCLFQTL